MLTKRAIEPEKGMWHLPGSFILKGEKQEECIKRILETELGHTGEYTSKLVNVFENLKKDPRGHIIDIIYKVDIPNGIPLKHTDETNEVRYFKNPPDETGFNHKEIVHSLLIL